ncbi:hypothetical protein ACP4OV_025649 [Aristida adscensionis]
MVFLFNAVGHQDVALVSDQRQHGGSDGGDGFHLRPPSAASQCSAAAAADPNLLKSVS